MDEDEGVGFFHDDGGAWHAQDVGVLPDTGPGADIHAGAEFEGGIGQGGFDGHGEGGFVEGVGEAGDFDLDEAFGFEGSGEEIA